MTARIVYLDIERQSGIVDGIWELKQRRILSGVRQRQHPIPRPGPHHHLHLPPLPVQRLRPMGT